jgi:hypothetical protein
MPRIAKGGKYVFGWSRIGEDGKFVIPGEALEEYKLKPNTEVILVPGSKTSGGFGISPRTLFENSRLSGFVRKIPELADLHNIKGEAIKYRGRYYFRSWIHENTLKLEPEVLEIFGAKPGDRLLSIRSSNIAIGMAVRGSIIEEAIKHPEIETF